MTQSWCLCESSPCFPVMMQVPHHTVNSVIVVLHRECDNNWQVSITENWKVGIQQIIVVAREYPALKHEDMQSNPRL